MKKIITHSLTALFMMASSSGVVGQNVGIGTALPEVRLDINGGVASKPASAAAAASITIPNNISTFYITNVTGVQANNLVGPATPSEGQLLIINNKDDNLATFAGLYQIRPNTTSSFIYLGGQWVPFGEAPTNRLAWSLYGNTGTIPGTGANQNFLGTRDNTNFIIATNVVERMRVLNTGHVIVNNNFNDYVGTNSPLKVNATGDDTWASISEHDMSGGALGLGDIVGTGGFATDYAVVGWTYGSWGIGDILAQSVGMGVVGEYGNYGSGVTGYAYYTNAANLVYPFGDDIGVLGHVNLTFGSPIETGGFFHSGQPTTKALWATQSMVQNDLLGTGPIAYAGTGNSEIFRMQHNGFTTGIGTVRGDIVLLNAFATPGTQTGGSMIGGHYQINGGINNTAGAASKIGVFGAIAGGNTNNITTPNQVTVYGLYGQNNQNVNINGAGIAFTGAVFGISTGNMSHVAPSTGSVLSSAVGAQNGAVPTGNNAYVSSVRGFTTTTTGNLANLTGVEGIVQAGGAFAGVFGYNAATTGAGPGLRGQANTYGTISIATRNPNANGDEVAGVYGVATNTTALSVNNTYKFGGLFEELQLGTYAYVGGIHRTGGVTTAYKILGSGAVSTIVENTKNEKVIMYAPESPEVLLQDYGKVQLINGKAHVTVDPDFAKNITGEIRVFVQLEGDCNGVYVTNKSNTGFDVIELSGGKSNVPFTYTIVGNRADEIAKNGQKITYSTLRFPTAPNRKVDPAVYHLSPIERATSIDESQLPKTEYAVTSNDRDPAKEEQIKKQKQELAKNKTYKHNLVVKGDKAENTNKD